MDSISELDGICVEQFGTGCNYMLAWTVEHVGAYLSGLEAAAGVCKRKGVAMPRDAASTLAKEAKRAAREDSN